MEQWISWVLGCRWAEYASALLPAFSMIPFPFFIYVFSHSLAMKRFLIKANDCLIHKNVHVLPSSLVYFMTDRAGNYVTRQGLRNTDRFLPCLVCNSFTMVENVTSFFLSALIPSSLQLGTSHPATLTVPANGSTHLPPQAALACVQPAFLSAVRPFHDASYLWGWPLPSPSTARGRPLALPLLVSEQHLRWAAQTEDVFPAELPRTLAKPSNQHDFNASTFYTRLTLVSDPCQCP